MTRIRRALAQLRALLFGPTAPKPVLGRPDADLDWTRIVAHPQSGILLLGPSRNRIADQKARAATVFVSLLVLAVLVAIGAVAFVNGGRLG